MAIGYRAILSAEYSATNLEQIVEVLRVWVTRKKGFETLPSKGDILSNNHGATLVANDMSDSSRGVSGYRWTLTEDWSPPKWYDNVKTGRTGVTQISLVFSEQKMWLWVDIEPPVLEYVDSAGRERVESQPSGTPAFVSEILSELEMHDGIESPVATIETIVNDSHVRHLVEVLRDPSRRGAVYVTSPQTALRMRPGWIERIEFWGESKVWASVTC